MCRKEILLFQYLIFFFFAPVRCKFNFIALGPNPTNNQVTVTYNLSGNSKNTTFELFDVFGSLVLKKELASGKNQLRLQLTDLSPGIYLCVVRNNTSRIQKKLVITH